MGTFWYEYKKEQLDMCKARGFTPLGEPEKDHFIDWVECNICKRIFRWNSRGWQLKHMKKHHPLEYEKLIKNLNQNN